MIFEEITGIQHGCGVKVVIYGQEGVGKSTLAAQFPDAVFIDCEGSTTKMDVRRLPKPTSWEMFRQEVEFVREQHLDKHYRTLIIDTFDWAEQLALAQICADHKTTSIEGIPYGKGWQYEAEEITRFLGLLDTLIQAGIHVVLLCHAITRKTTLPEELDEFDHWELKLGSKTTNKIAPLLKEWSDMTLFLAFYTNVVAADDKGRKHKATSCQRVMYTTKSAWWDAKNRFDLPERLPLAWESIAAIFQSPVEQLIQKAQRQGIACTPVSEMGDTSQNCHKPPGDSSLPECFNGLQPSDFVPLSVQDGSAYAPPEGVPAQLAALMQENLVTAEELEAVSVQKGYMPKGMPLQAYPEDYLIGCLAANWQAVMEMITINRLQ